MQNQLVKISCVSIYYNKLSETLKPIYNGIKNNKILRKNITKEMKHMYNENFKILMKGIEDTNEWKESCIHGLEEYC